MTDDQEQEKFQSVMSAVNQIIAEMKKDRGTIDYQRIATLMYDTALDVGPEWDLSFPRLADDPGSPF